MYVLVVAGGFLLGLATGRWWALALALIPGVWIGLVEEVEVPGWVLGAGYTGLAAAGIAAGVVTRRSITHP
jgi:hypothetical protein